MIIDALLAPLLDAVQWAIDRLPTGEPLALPNLDPWWATLRGLDSLIPVMGPVAVALSLLGMGAVFVVVRLILTVWNLIWP